MASCGALLQEEKWKREQKAAAEQKKLQELQQQYDEERKNAEYTDLAAKAGYMQCVLGCARALAPGALPHVPQCCVRCRSSNKMDWMYSGQIAAKEDAAKRQVGVAHMHAVPPPATPDQYCHYAGGGTAGTAGGHPGP
jgi:ParB-like chromosome segregation protein Spo0J